MELSESGNRTSKVEMVLDGIARTIYPSQRLVADHVIPTLRTFYQATFNQYSKRHLGIDKARIH